MVSRCRAHTGRGNDKAGARTSGPSILISSTRPQTTRQRAHSDERISAAWAPSWMSVIDPAKAASAGDAGHPGEIFRLRHVGVPIAQLTARDRRKRGSPAGYRPHQLRVGGRITLRDRTGRRNVAASRTPGNPLQLRAVPDAIAHGAPLAPTLTGCSRW